MQERLAVIRTTKLDLAQWITSGIAVCQDTATSLCLARYAAAQLESAALIPMAPHQRTRRASATSLLRRELKSSPRPDSNECALILARVSRAMIAVLAGAGSNDTAVIHLIRHEASASRQIKALARG